MRVGITGASFHTLQQLANWTVWQLASHMAGSRAHWFHDVLGEGDEVVGHMVAVEATTVPDLPLEDAGWEDDETIPARRASSRRGWSERGR